MPTQVLMPQFGESVIEGTLTRWLVSPGDAVQEYQPILEVNTDKVDTEIPSPVTGIIIEILVPEGQTVRAGTILARIGEADGEKASIEQQVTPASSATEQGYSVQLTEKPTERSLQLSRFISPVVAKIAKEHNLDPTQVKGSGMGGRVTKNDILAFIETQNESSANKVTPYVQKEAGKPEGKPTVTPGTLPGELIPLTPVRRSIAEHMLLSKHISPHVTTIMETDMSRVVSHREQNKEVFSRENANLTFSAYFVITAVAALKAFPMVNSSWTEEGIRLHNEINIGIATSLGESGLIVPVIKNADGLSLLGLARAIQDLSSRARARKLLPEEVKGGTFTITNHGVSGSLFATPIINQPQAAILGVGMIQKRVVAINDAIAIRPMVYLGLTFDHRILDGAMADHFLGRMVELLQNWNT